MLKAKLVIVGGRTKAKEVNLRLPTIIGRGKEADLTIPHALVSRSHSKLFELDGQLCVRDLGSLNGTFVDNQRIESEQIIEPNQLLTLGNITFRAVYEIDHSAKKTLTDTLPDSLQTIVIPPAAKPQAVTAALGTTGATEAADPVIELAETTSHRSAISEIDSFDPDEIGSLKSTPENVQPQTQPVASRPTITIPAQPTLQKPEPNKSPIKQPPVHSVNLQAQPAEVPVDLGIDDLTGEAPVAQISSLDVDLDIPDDSVANPVSFVGAIQTDDDSKSPSLIDDFHIDLGEDDDPQASIDESQLGSFLKNLPK